MKSFRAIVLALMLVLIPSVAFAQNTNNDQNAATNSESEKYSYKRQGVFGCNQTGAYAMSVGSLSAVGGVYVPVNDAAITLNTGYLTYKECVLRGISNRQREAAIAGLVQQILNSILSGRDGNPYFVSSIDDERVDVEDAATLRVLQGGSLDAVNPAYRSSIQRAVAQSYLQGRNQSNKVLECPYKGNLKAALEGKEFSLELLGHLMNPACNPLGAFMLAKDYTENVANNAVRNREMQWQWGDGFYPVEQCDASGKCKTVTPSAAVQGNLMQALQSGFSQLERVNDIDQMVGALFSGITSQVIGDNRGLQGLVSKTGTQPSYIEQVVREAGQGLRDAAGNAALQILAAAKQIEVAYRQAMAAIEQSLVAAIQDLRAKEAACWRLVVQSVCTAEPGADKTCTPKGTGCIQTATTTCPTAPTKLKVATSTAFSQQVIDARITSLASSTINNIEKSNTAIGLIDRLIAGITNTASIDAQRVALQQLDNLVAQRALHSQYDLQAAQKAKEDVAASMDTLRSDTVKAWADSPDVNVGWCNVNNTEVLKYWQDKWKQ